MGKVDQLSWPAYSGVRQHNAILHAAQTFYDKVSDYPGGATYVKYFATVQDAPASQNQSVLRAQQPNLAAPADSQFAH